uniref:chloroplast protein-transporting ATPase n=1 Tax=Lactuca sativa TaxID=4236 RepID=A0A9R1UGQ3_LACSA|nr:hypothetical protein LSAT_V11C900464360 [Lactuca sativa]
MNRKQHDLKALNSLQKHSISICEKKSLKLICICWAQWLEELQIFYRQDVQYIVKNGKALIINELTGRVEEKRRWSEGIHLAVEAKEGLPIQADSVVVAQITYQSMFKLYPKLSRMTGTAKTEEFLKMFQMPVIEVPTNMANIRHDLPIQAFAIARGKWEYVRVEVESMFRVGRPVLVGTTSVENSEYLSALLRASKIPHNVLNARPKVAILSFGPNVNVNGIWFWVNNAAKYVGKSENKSWTYEKAKGLWKNSQRCTLLVLALQLPIYRF